MVDKMEISGLTILFIGVALLVFTFLNAYWFLTQNIGLVGTGDLVKAFGEALAPLIATCIRVMYLGVMGWVGSMLTLRGLSMISQIKTKEGKREVATRIVSKRVVQPKAAGSPRVSRTAAQQAEIKAQKPETPAPAPEPTPPSTVQQETSEKPEAPTPEAETKKEEAETEKREEESEEKISIASGEPAQQEIQQAPHPP